MNRFNLYSPVHKGLRGRLFETAQLVARSDFSRRGETATAVAAVRDLLGFLEEHAEHEDAVIMPLLRDLSPELAMSLHAEHSRTAGLHRVIATLLERIERAAHVQHVALGQRLSERLGELICEQVRHLAREESEANRVLRAHHSDAELRELEGRILASIPSDRLSEWLVLILPSLNGTERNEMLAGMRSSLPDEEYAQLTAPALARLRDRPGADVAAVHAE